jgi:hypothetical protein
MPAAEAQISTPNARRYLTQFCKHAQQIHRLPHRPPTHEGGLQPLPTVEHAEFSETDGMVSLGWGRCVLHATPGTLTLRAEATSNDHLHRIQDIIAADIQRFGAREQLTITWQHLPAE